LTVFIFIVNEIMRLFQAIFDLNKVDRIFGICREILTKDSQQAAKSQLKKR
jgi:hypothetical protein